MTFIIRKVRLPDDYIPMASLLNTLGDEPLSARDLEFADCQVPQVGRTSSNAEGLLTGTCRERVVAEDEFGRVLGYAIVSRDGMTLPGIVDGLVVVHPDHRNQGIGSALANHLETWAHQQGAAQLVAVGVLPVFADLARKRGYQEEHSGLMKRL